MGWMGPGEHEGWVQSAFADGTLSSGTTTGAGIYAEGYTYDATGDIDPTFLRPYSDVNGWLMACECGWRDTTIHPVPDDGRAYPDPTDAEEDALLLPSWQAHVRPFRALDELAELTDDARSIDARITEAVESARRNGASWADIGRELGMTKQGAQQRYGI